MSLDSRLRLARKNGAGVNLRHFEVPTICEALELLRACERAEAKGPLPAPPFPASIGRDLVEAELRDTLDTGRQRIVDLGGDCDPVDRMLEGAMHSLDMRAQSKARDDANPFILSNGPAVPLQIFVVDKAMPTPREVADAAGDLVLKHAARLGMDSMAAGVLERAVRALGGAA